jgi:outer membrane protein OmpA-like peptidoglycan-associated protein
MRNRPSRVSRASLALLALAFLGLSACAPRNVFVLMPDAEGRVGAITVENEKGRQTLDKEGQGVVVGGPGRAPEAPREVAPEDMEKWFAAVRKAEPEPPRVFTLLFSTGTAELTPESENQLPAVLAAIRERNSKDVSVVGHSDRQGAEELNWKLSMDRAHAVREILVERGVPETIIETTSHGENNPRIPTADGVSEPRNRRVEVTVR